MKKYVIALDQGTTSSRAILFDREQNIVEMAQSEFSQYYPKPGWVEHDPMEIYASQYGVMIEVLAKSGVSPEEIAAIGITNQRETAVVWDKNTGRPIHNAIVWQCRRTAEICDQMQADGMEPIVRQKTGLKLDAYFSGTKIKWLLDYVPGARERAQRGELLFGTVDSWLLWKLTGGKSHATDYTNASRTMLFNLHTLDWDDEMLDYLQIPKSMMPKLLPSDADFGNVNIEGVEVPIHGIAGDQQAALFGQKCFQAGSAKNTYGTGCFLLMNTGDRPVLSENGLLTTVGIAAGGSVQYALEGSVFVGGAIIQWLRDEMKLIGESCDSEYFARKVKDNGGVYLVPAFTGLGAPYWDMKARGAIFGLTRGANKNHLIRAALESIAYQTNDVIVAMEKDLGSKITVLRIDGGASANDLLAQFQSDITNTSVVRPMIRETTALGAAYLAGLGVGFWKNLEEIDQNWTLDKRFDPEMDEKAREKNLAGWHKAVKRSCEWED
ncbi:MAG: glycerol kinase GlpK [Oscillospiraceae bacterium]|nr:glycerol kinase GlpK [Oscillospiraceae bacterium]